MLEGSGQLIASSGDKRKLSLKSGLALNPAVPQAHKPLPSLGQFPHSCAGCVQRQPNSATAAGVSFPVHLRTCQQRIPRHPSLHGSLPPPASQLHLHVTRAGDPSAMSEPSAPSRAWHVGSPRACLYMELGRPSWNAGQKPRTSVLSRGSSGTITRCINLSFPRAVPGIPHITNTAGGFPTCT